MIALARLSAARGLFHLSIAIAVTWLAHIAIYKAEAASGGDLHWLNTAADFPLVIWAAWRATRPAYPGAVIFAAAAIIVTVQSVLVLLMAKTGFRHFWIDFSVNRLFDLLLILIIGLAAARIARRMKQARAERAAQPPEARRMTTDPDALPPFWRLVYNALAATHNSERPETEHIAYARPVRLASGRQRTPQRVYSAPNPDDGD